MPELYDAIVVGAGPVGSYLAYRLAKLGHKVIVFERHSKVGDAVCCTGIVGKECLDRFPVADNAISNQASSAKIFSPSGKLLNMRKDTIQAYVVDRAAFDDALARRAQEEGAEYLLSATVDDIAVGDHCVSVEVRYEGRVRKFEGRMAVISSGFGASLPNKLGLGRISDFVLGAQAEVSVKDVDEVEVYLGQNVAPGFFAWLVPTSSGNALAGLLARHSPAVYFNDFLLNLFVQGKIASADVKRTYGGIPLTPLPKTYGERLVVVGDAAGQVKPTTGGGIYFGMLCADVAADTIHGALCADDLSAKRLAHYEEKWKGMLARELRMGYWARRLYEKLSDNQIERIFEVVHSNNIHEDVLQSPDFSFDWHSDSILKALKYKSLGRIVWAMTRGILPL